MLYKVANTNWPTKLDVIAKNEANYEKNLLAGGAWPLITVHGSVFCPGGGPLGSLLHEQ